MSNALQNVDWDLLHRQKLTLLAIRERQQPGSSEYDALSGIIHLLDAVQDEAEQVGGHVPEKTRQGGDSL